jgi:cell division protein FtsN
MKLENYISDLLYRYECVIVPDFGGFVTSNIGSTIDYNNNCIYPPSKKIAFNSYLKTSDGLLVNYIAGIEQISYDEAIHWIENQVIRWNKTLENGVLVLSKIGNFKLSEEGKLQFEPTISENYLTSSFGLTPVVSVLIEKEVAATVQKKTLAKPVLVSNIPSEKPAIAASSEPQKTTRVISLPRLVKYAAAASVAITLFGLGNNYYQQKLQNDFIAATEQYQQKTEQKIQEATFIISNPLPTITLHVEKEAKNFHVIAGAFRNEDNAATKVAQLKQDGFDAHIVEVNKWSLTQVAFGSYASMEEATKVLTQILNTRNEEAWVLVTKN